MNSLNYINLIPQIYYKYYTISFPLSTSDIKHGLFQKKILKRCERYNFLLKFNII